MTLSQLKEILEKYPGDMEVQLGHDEEIFPIDDVETINSLVDPDTRDENPCEPFILISY